MLKDFLIKNNINPKGVIDLYIFITQSYSEIGDWNDNHEAYEYPPEIQNVVDELEIYEREYDNIKNLYKKECPEADFDSEVYELFCDYLENKVEDIKQIKEDMPFWLLEDENERKRK